MRPIVILDFGSQFAHLIGNRVRRLEAHSEIVPTDTPAADIAAMNPAGIILSGGPQSVFADGSPQPDPAIFDLEVPFLGICYGHQLLAHHHGATIGAEQKEFGEAVFTHSDGALFDTIPTGSTVWMNHGDSVLDLPAGFSATGSTADCSIAAFENSAKNIHSVQFHPEVTHSQYGMQMLGNFVDVCSARGTWQMSDVLDKILADIEQQAKDKNVFLLVSGGVDSSVAFALLTKALGTERVQGLFVDNGLMRQNEVEEVPKMLADAGFDNLLVAREGEQFLQNLAGTYDPEDKRLIIGNTFLDVQRQWAQKLKLDGPEWLLGQGTIYPDHIETGGSANASKIKTHHNRVPEIEKMIQEGRIIEPLHDLYKDEVREIGLLLGLPAAMVERHPFPGPGLGVRILCQKSTAPLAVAEEMEKNIQEKFGHENIILPIQSVGVQGDARSYRHPVAIFSDTNPQGLVALATAIPNAFHDLNRVLICLSQSSRPKEIFAIGDSDLSTHRVALLQEADARIRAILVEHDLMTAVWQFPVVLLPLGTESGTESIILRPIQSENAMTATAVVFDQDILVLMTASLMDIAEISTVYIDITSKPPGTIEWE